jgi:citrate lyase beta subunit
VLPKAEGAASVETLTELLGNADIPILPIATETPTQAEITHAQAVIEIFAASLGAGALKLEGKMIDRPHLIQAERIMALVAS